MKAALRCGSSAEVILGIQHIGDGCMHIFPGRLALLLALSGYEDGSVPRLPESCVFCVGKVGSTELEKVIAAVETAAIRENVVAREIPDLHALYHAIDDALVGLLRGQMALGHSLRTVGLRFAVVRTRELDGRGWIAVAMYGTIGSMMKGNEHEAAGLGICHL